MEIKEVEDVVAAPVAAPLSRKDFTLKLISEFKSGEAHLSYSSLSKFMESPRTFIDYKMKKSQTVYQKGGSLFHAMALEPKIVAKQFETDRAIVDKIGGSKPRGTNAYKEWLSSRDDKKTLVSSEEWDDAVGMTQAVMQNDASLPLIKALKRREKKYETVIQGYKFVAYIDGECDDFRIDLKSTKDANVRSFQRDIMNLKYWFQAGVYTAITEEYIPYKIIAVDKQQGVSVHSLEEDLIMRGTRELEKQIKMFDKCVDQNLFHMSYDFHANMPDGSFSVPLPAWL